MKADIIKRMTMLSVELQYVTEQKVIETSDIDGLLESFEMVTYKELYAWEVKNPTWVVSLKPFKEQPSILKSA